MMINFNFKYLLVTLSYLFQTNELSIIFHFNSPNRVKKYNYCGDLTSINMNIYIQVESFAYIQHSHRNVIQVAYQFPTLFAKIQSEGVNLVT